MTAPTEERTWLLDQLPAFMAEDLFFRKFVQIFTDLADSVRAEIDAFDYLADVDITSDTMVRYMGAWVGADIVDASLPVDRQRELVANVGATLQWRGTRRGLTTLLELVTGGPVEVTDNGGIFNEGESPANDDTVTVRVSKGGAMSDEDLLRLIRAELPVTCRVDLHVEPPPARKSRRR